MDARDKAKVAELVAAKKSDISAEQMETCTNVVDALKQKGINVIMVVVGNSNVAAISGFEDDFTAACLMGVSMMISAGDEGIEVETADAEKSS